MTKNEAIYRFFSGFGLTAYPLSAVPEDVIFPYLTYENTIGNAGDDAVSITAYLWFHTDEEKTPNAKAEEISQAIGRGGKQIAYDDGTIWIRRGTPWCNAMSDASDPQIKQRIINIELEFI